MDYRARITELEARITQLENTARVNAEVKPLLSDGFTFGRIFKEVMKRGELAPTLEPWMANRWQVVERPSISADS